MIDGVEHILSQTETDCSGKWISIESAQGMITAVATDCIRHIAMIGVSNYENEDVMWTVEKAIETIQCRYGINSSNS